MSTTCEQDLYFRVIQEAALPNNHQLLVWHQDGKNWLWKVTSPNIEASCDDHQHDLIGVWVLADDEASAKRDGWAAYCKWAATHA